MRKKRTTITKQIINNTYALYLKGVDYEMMSSVLSISPSSIKRIVKLIKAAESGDYQTFESVSGYEKTKSMVRVRYKIRHKAGQRSGRRQNRRADRRTRRVMCRGNKRLITPSMRIA